VRFATLDWLVDPHEFTMAPWTIGKQLCGPTLLSQDEGDFKENKHFVEESRL